MKYNILMESTVTWINGWTMGGKLSVLLFIIFAAGIVFTAIKMVKYSEVIMGKTKFGGAFIGGALIAAFASMPELITEIVQGLEGKPGVGTADDIGANAFSAFAMGIAIVVLVSHPFIFKIGKFSKISLLTNSALGFALAIFMFINKDVNMGVSGKFVIGIIPIVMLSSYILFLVLQWKYSTDEEEVDPESIKGISIKKGITLFAVYGFLVVILAVLINLSVSSMQDGYGISSESAGGLFLSMTTSLPEIVAFIALLKSGQKSAAIAALVGSQMFNLGITVFGDMAYSSEAMFNNPEVSKNWTLTLIFAIEMLFIGIYALVGKKIKNKKIRIAIPSLSVLTYIIGWTLILTIQNQ